MKEENRGKAGDSLTATTKSRTGTPCEIELESWGVGLYAAKSSPNLAVVEQADTDYTTLTWIDLTACRTVKSVRALGKAHSTAFGFRFLEERIYLGKDCLPK